MRRVIIESPYESGRGWSIEDNIEYARRAVRSRVLKGDAPIASHLLFTQEGILNDGDPEQRALGIKAGLVWAEIAHTSIFFIDHGWSSGMICALRLCFLHGRPFEVRKLDIRKWLLPLGLDENHKLKILIACKED